MHRVLGVSEIITQILSYLPTSSNAGNARVCKDWSDTALDLVWAKIEDLDGIWGSLVETKMDVDGKLEFRRVPTRDDWQPFLTNCKRIRSISFDNPPRLSQTTLYQIAATRPVVTLFPNLQTISGDIDAAYFGPPYMSPTVRCLTMRGEILDAKLLRSRAQQIVENMPFLTSFFLCAGGHPSLIEPGLCRLLEALPDLIRIHLPMDHFLPHLVYRLSRISRLRCLDFSFPGSQRNSSQHNRQFIPRLDNNAFPGLQKLTLLATLPEMHSFLLHENFPTLNLTTLSLAFCDNSYSHLLRDLLENLAMVSPALESLSFYTKHGILPRVTFADFSAVLKFPCLSEFTFYGDTELAFSDEEAEHLASHWPHLIRLDLSPDFPLSTSCDLTLRSLAHFARYCPKLKVLGLCVDTEFDIPSHTEAHRFTALEELNLTMSPIYSSHEIVRFITTSLPDTAQFYYVDDSDEAGPFSETWKRVDETVAAVLEARKETRAETRRSVKAEMEDLRRENAALRSQIQQGQGSS